MHDLGRIQMENFEYDFETESGIFSEAETAELATELLEVQSEQELEQFLGDLIKRAGSAIGTFIKSPTGQALGGILKGAAKQALPMVGSALGGWVGGDAGAKLGSKFASLAGDKLGLEMENEMESAKDFVRMAANAVQEVAAAPPSAQPAAAANAAVSSAASKHFPTLLSMPASSGGRQGTWIRRGNRIIVLGV